MPEMEWKQSGFIYSACEPFSENIDRTHKFEKTEYSKYIIKKTR